MHAIYNNTHSTYKNGEETGNLCIKWADVDMGTVSQKYQKIMDVLYE